MLVGMILLTARKRLEVSRLLSCPPIGQTIDPATQPPDVLFASA